MNCIKVTLANKNGRYHAALRLVMLVGISLPISAQLPSLFTPNQGGATTAPSANPMGPQGQYRPCTPAEYGDPAADCIPSASGSSGSSYGDADASGAGAGNGIPMPIPANEKPGTQQPAPMMAPPTYYEKEPPTEFQRYVAASVGQMLPIFGASLFERVPATFAPLDRNPVGADYVLAPGDELQIAVWGQFNFTRHLVISRTGEVVLPEAGPISVAGMSYSQAAAVFKSTLAHFYKNFDLNVTLGKLHSVQVFVVGEARRPGSYTVSSLSTLVNAIFASGGPSARGSMRSIQLKRGNRTISQFDLYELLMHGDKSCDSQLVSGDVILIPAAGPRVAVAGSIEHPGIYEVKADTTLGEVIELADGASPLASRRQVLLERVEAGAALTVLRIPMTPEGLRTELRNGDLVRLVPIVQRFENTVALRGNVADPGKFPWQEGMRLSDLIPDKEFLLTRNYWKERNGLSVPDDLTGDQNANHTVQSESVDSTASSQQLAAVRPPANPALPMSSREETRNTQGDTSLGASTGLDNIPPVRTFPPRNTVQPGAPDINWEYAVVERIDQATLATNIIPFNLGKLVLAHDPSQDLSLKAGDVVTIFSKADFSVPRAQQVKQVRLEGEIAMAGVYTVKPGETLRELVARAGGLTGNAYLYGAQFTRESTRREQQKRYDDFVNQFDRQMSEAASNLSSQVTSPQQAATAQTSLAGQRDLLERLRKVSMNGRIVLDMEPNSRGEKAIPDLPLENGDRLYVPSRPSTVNVIGTVFEQAAFLYEEDLRTGDYLKKSGGPSRAADRSHMFVIRADGSVVSRSTGPILFAKNFDALPMYPGDTLIVPTYINKSTFTRNLIDWSQILSNLALGAAAVNILH
jgi:polysaccharide biosynthesis/export protein